jgi:hypothetical protein
MDTFWKSSSIIESFYGQSVTFDLPDGFFQKNNLNNRSGQISKSKECFFTKSMQSMLFTYLAKPIIHGIGSTKYPQKRKGQILRLV